MLPSGSSLRRGLCPVSVRPGSVLAVWLAVAMGLGLLPSVAFASHNPDGVDPCAAAPPAVQFVDRDTARQVHASSIDCAAFRQVAVGSTNSRGQQVFHPGPAVTRAQMASFIARTLVAGGYDQELPDGAGTGRFEDVSGNVHQLNINRLAQAGIVEGIAAGTYSPDASVTRQQMAAFVVRAARFALGKDHPIQRDPPDRFGDVDTTNVHKDNIEAGADAVPALFRGVSASSFDPLTTVQRDQMASFLVNLLRSIFRAAVTDPEPTTDPDPTASPDPTTDPDPTASPDPTTDPDPDPDPLTVPDVVGLRQGKAVTVVTDAGLDLGDVDFARSATVPAGQVLDQDPDAGTRVDRGSRVDVQVSLGAEPLQIPDVVGLEQEQAADVIDDAGFTVGAVLDTSSDTVEVGQVDTQLPQAGQVALPGTPVDLDIARGTINDPPEITTDPATRHTTGGEPYRYDADATDPDDDDLTWVLQSGPNGVDLDASTGELRWEPGEGDVGPLDLVVRVEDGRGGIDTQSFTVQVTRANRPPVATDDVYSTAIDEMLQVEADAGLLSNDTDPDEDPLTFAELVETPQNGRVEVAEDGSFTYTPSGPGSPGNRYTDIDLTRFSLAAGDATPVQRGFPAANLFDRYHKSFWVSDGSAGQTGTITLSFDAPVSPSTLELIGIRDAGGNADAGLGLREVDVELLDGDGGVVLAVPGATFPPNTPGDQRDADLEIDLAAEADGAAPSGIRTVVIDIVRTDGGRPGLGEVVLTGEGPSRNLSPEIEWSWTDDTGGNDGAGMVAPTVGDLDGDGLAEVLFHAAPPTYAASSASVLYALDGGDGSVRWQTGRTMSTASSPVLGDLDDDGFLEVVAVSSSGREVVVLDHEGQELTKFDTGGVVGNLALADLDGDGVPEIIAPVGGQVAALTVDVTSPDLTMAERWRTTGSGGCGGQTGAVFCVPAIADIDLDGRPEIVLGNRVVGADGTVEALSTLFDGFVAIGNFDADPQAEIVHVAAGQVRLLDHDLSVQWGPVPIPLGGSGGPPTVGDFDADGRPEIGVAGSQRYVVLDTDGTQLWAMPTVDGTSNITGSTLFDFDNDGNAEVVYRDERHLWLFDGATGDVRHQTPMGSLTLIEYPIVADVDGDGQAEIVVPSDSDTALPDGTTRQNGLYVFGGPLGDWVRARPIWNQHAYHVTNIEADGTIPRLERPNWLAGDLNNYRENAFLQDEVSALDRFTYRATDGEAVDEAVAYVDIHDPENAPRITCVPTAVATVGIPYSGRVCAEDPDGDELSFSGSAYLAAGSQVESGLRLDSTSGLLLGTPTTTGDVRLTVTVTDSTGRTAGTVETIQVREPAMVPDLVGTQEGPAGSTIVGAGLVVGAITSAPSPTVPIGQVVLQFPPAGAAVPSGRRVDLTVSSGPSPAVQDVDGDGFTVELGDCDDTDASVKPGVGEVVGDGIDQDCDGEDEGPVAQDPSEFVGVGLRAQGGPLVVGRDRTYTVEARRRNGRVVDVTDRSTIVVSDPAVATVSDATVTGRAAGATTVVATFESTSVTAPLQVIAAVAADDVSPTATITSPTSGDEVTGTVTVRGTAADANLTGWSATVQTPGGAALAVVGRGTGSVSDGVLGTFDPSRLPPGPLVVHLVVEDAGGNTATADVPITRPTGAGDADADGDGFSPNQGDCDDTAAGVNPDAVEIRDDGIDQDCDGADAVTPSAEPAPSDIVAVGITGSDAPLVVGRTRSYTAQAQRRDGRVIDVTDLANYSLTTPGVASIAGRTVTALAAGSTEVQARYGGIGATKSLQVGAVTPDDGVVPVAEITSPAPGDEAGLELVVSGVATDANLTGWTVTVVDGAGVQLAEVGRGTTPVDGGAFGTVATAVLPPGVVTVRLDVEDAGGNVSRVEVPVRIVPGPQAGVFGVAFTDVVVPAAGLPLQVVRSYDGRDLRNGDFGAGWTLDVSGLDLEISADQGLGWELVPGRFATGLRASADHTVTITLPDGDQEVFDLSPSPDVATFIPLSFTQARYVPRRGTTGRLSPTGNTNLIVLPPGVGQVELVDDATLDPYEPKGFVYTDLEGTRFEIDREGDVERIVEPNGNTITVTDAGIVHSAGPSVTFTRDALGRITRVRDPEGNAQTYTYDARGDLVRHTDREGGATTYRYADGHRLTGIVDPLGRSVARVEYDAAGRLVATIDAEGRRTEIDHDLAESQEIVTNADSSQKVFLYDADGNIVSQTDEIGRTTSRTFDADGNRTSETDPLGHTTSFAFDDRGRETSRTDAEGGTTTYAYDASGRMLSTTLPGGAAVTYERDTAGNVLRQTDADGNVTESSYDGAGNRVSVTDATGGTTVYGYDGVGNRTRVVGPDGTEASFGYDRSGNVTSQTVQTARGEVTVRASYDRNGQLTRTVDALGNASTTTYDAAGDITAETGPDGRTVRHEYGLDGRRTATVLPDGSRVSSDYDVRGRLEAVTDAEGDETVYTYNAASEPTALILPDGTPGDLGDNPRRSLGYDAAGRPTAVTGEGGGLVGLGYDDAGNVVGVQDAAGGGVRQVLDARGRLVEEIDELGRSTAYTYDESDHVLSIGHPDGTSQSFTYDARGNLRTETDEAGATWTHGYDDAGQLTSVQDPTGATTTYRYDALGNPTAMIDALGRTTRYERDARGLITAVVLPDGSREQREYGARRQLVAVVDAFGDRTELEHDELGRVVRRSDDDGEVTTEYAGTDGPTAVTTSDGTATYAHDDAGRIVAATTPDGHRIDYGYRADSAVASVATADGTTSYETDPEGRVISVTDAAGTTAQAYDAAGNLVRTALPNGVVETRSYDSRDRVTSIAAAGPAGAVVVVDLAYTYEPTGRVDTAVDAVAGTTASYDYDPLGRLVRAAVTGGATPRTTTYTYDAVGNRIRQSDSAGGTARFAYDATDRLLTATGGGQDAEWVYDAVGNQLARTTAEGATAYGWTTRGELTSVRDQPVSEPARLTTHDYDAASLRVASTVDAQTTRYRYDRLRQYPEILEEHAGDGALLARSTLSGERLARTAGGTTSFLHTDQLGSVVATTDPAGATSSRTGYDAFGQVSETTGQRPPFGFTGEPQDDAGLVYLRARWTDPSTGRFLSRDPFPGYRSDPRSAHDYSYAYGDPVNVLDPSGLSPGPSLVELSVSFAIASGITALGTGLIGAAQAGKRLDWSGDTYDFGLEYGGLSFGVGVHYLNVENRGHRTEGRFLLLTVGAGFGLGDALKKAAGPRGDALANAGASNLSRRDRRLSNTYVASEIFTGGMDALSAPVSYDKGDATVTAPVALGGRNGIDPVVLSGPYLKFGLSVGTGLLGSALAVASGGSSTSNNTAGASVYIHGFGAGQSIPDYSFSTSPSFDVGAAAGISIGITPPSKKNQPVG